MTIRIPIKKIDPNPTQPRKHFDKADLQSLARSIGKRGLLQPITVRPKDNGRYEIVAGERRWRAHCLLVGHGKTEFAEIKANVEKMTKRQRDIAAIIENVQRADMNPIEEANGYRALMDEGMTEQEVIDELGIGRQLLLQRLDLLKLSEPIRKLVSCGQITAHVGFCIAMVPERMQNDLLRKISSGQLRIVDQIRHAAMAMRDVAAQADAFASMPAASGTDKRKLASLEQRIEQVGKLVQVGFKDGECIAAKRVSPDRIKKAADQLALIRKHIYQMEHALRCAAAQGEIIQDAA